MEVAESRYWRAQAISLGLPPDTPPEDLLLVEPVVDASGHMLGCQPARAVTEELRRCERWAEDERRKAEAQCSDVASASKRQSST